MAALGKKPRSIARFIWTEIVLIVVVAAALASVLGWILAEMLIAMMQHAFDPPPDHLAIPWGFLGALTVVVVAGAAPSLRSSPSVRSHECRSGQCCEKNDRRRPADSARGRTRAVGARSADHRVGDGRSEREAPLARSGLHPRQRAGGHRDRKCRGARSRARRDLPSG